MRRRVPSPALILSLALTAALPAAAAPPAADKGKAPAAGGARVQPVVLPGASTGLPEDILAKMRARLVEQASAPTPADGPPDGTVRK